MKGFKLNKKYDHKADVISDALKINKEKSDVIIDKIIKYWDSLTPEKFMISKILDFIEQQDWSLIEKLYAVERFSTIYNDESTFGYYNEDLIRYIINKWKEKGTITDEETTREYLKHMFKLLSGYNLECLINTLRDVDDLAEKFEPEGDSEEDEIEHTPEEIEERKKLSLMDSAIKNINMAIPDSMGVVIFSKEGYIVTAKTPEMASLIQDTLRAGQKGFIADKIAQLNFYQ